MPGGKTSDLHFFWVGHGPAQPVLLSAEQSPAAEGLSSPIFIDACAGEQPVSAPIPPISPAEDLARSIVAVIGTHQAGRRATGHNAREVVDALAIAASQLLSGYAQNLPAGTDLVQALVDRIQEQSRGVAGSGTSKPRGPTH